MIDVVGVGALNIDFLADAPPVPLERGSETALDAARIPSGAPASLGGSAFNTVRALALPGSGAGLSLGYVGVAGRSPVPDLSPTAAMDAYGIDRRFVFDSPQLCGTCLAVMRDGERTLLTHPGANLAFPDHLDRAFDDLVAYLGEAKIVHVTSFLDARTPPKLVRLLTAVRERGTLVSFDPGHVWSTARTPAVERLVGLADLLLVNPQEFHALRRVPTGATVVVKHAAGIRVGNRFVPQVPLATDQIVNATGAGDVFAAGLLLTLARGGPIADGCTLGLRMARQSLSQPGGPRRA